MDRRVKHVLELMKTNPGAEPTLQHFAESVNLSPARLSFLFKAEIGVSPIRYLRMLRMEDAATLLSSTFLTVKEIMVRTGIADSSHFVRDFKRAYGVTPTEYRALHHSVATPKFEHSSR